MSEQQLTDKEASVMSAYSSWHHLLHKKLYELEYFLLAVKSDVRAAGLTSVKADEFIESRIAEIRTDLKQNRNKIYSRQK